MLFVESWRWPEVGSIFLSFHSHKEAMKCPSSSIKVAITPSFFKDAYYWIFHINKNPSWDQKCCSDTTQFLWKKVNSETRRLASHGHAWEWICGAEPGKPNQTKVTTLCPIKSIDDTQLMTAGPVRQGLKSLKKNVRRPPTVVRRQRPPRWCGGGGGKRDAVQHSPSHNLIHKWSNL